MVMPLINLIGHRKGRLKILRRAEDGTLPSGRTYVRWHAACDCGKRTIVSTNNFRSGSPTQSCGCRRRENEIGPHIIHGESGRSMSAEYRAWIAVKTRCNNPNQNRYADYGGRGIAVCKRWDNSYSNFLSDMGRRPSAAHSLERTNVNKGYSPSNCIWATRKEQMANQRRRARINQFSDQELAAELTRRGYPNPLRVPQHHGVASARKE